MTKHYLSELPPEAVVPISLAHKVIGRSSSTIYRWVETKRIVPDYTPDGMTIAVGALQDAEAGVVIGRPPARRGGKGGKT